MKCCCSAHQRVTSNMFDPNCPASCYNVDLTRNTALLSHPGLWHHGVPDDDFQWLLPSEQDPQGGW